MAYVRIGWLDSQELMGEEGFEENCVATEESGEFLVDEDWLDEIGW